MAYGFIVDRSYQITINTNGGGQPESFIAFFLGSRDLRNTPNPPVEYTFLKVANDEAAERIYIYKDEIGPGEGQYTITPRMQRDQTGGRTKKNMRSKKQKRNRRQTKNTRRN